MAGACGLLLLFPNVVDRHVEVDGVLSRGAVGFPKFRQVCQFLGNLPDAFLG